MMVMAKYTLTIEFTPQYAVPGKTYRVTKRLTADNDKHAHTKATNYVDRFELSHGDDCIESFVVNYVSGKRTIATNGTNGRKKT